MSKFFQSETAAFGGKSGFSNVEFKKSNVESSVSAEAGTVLEIIPMHIKNPPVIQFVSYLTNIRDSFQVQSTANQPFGRTDPYYIWKSNKRTIGLGFSIPSSGKSSALQNLNNLSWFLASLYPTYKDTQTATSFAASPMFRVRFSNIVCSSTKDGQGLLGVIKNVTVTHDPKEGFIGMNPSNMGTDFANVEAKVIKDAGFDNSVREGKRFLVPKLIKINFTFDVVHDHALGWDYHTGGWRGGLSAPRFPYDFGLLRDVTDTPSAGTAVFDDSSPETNNVPDSPEQKEAQAVANDHFGPGVTDQQEFVKVNQ